MVYTLIKVPATGRDIKRWPDLRVAVAPLGRSESNSVIHLAPPRHFTPAVLCGVLHHRLRHRSAASAAAAARPVSKPPTARHRPPDGLSGCRQPPPPPPPPLPLPPSQCLERMTDGGTITLYVGQPANVRLYGARGRICNVCQLCGVVFGTNQLCPAQKYSYLQFFLSKGIQYSCIICIRVFMLRSLYHTSTYHWFHSHV